MTDGPADRLAQALVANGCDIAFGVPGGGPNLDVVGAMDANGIRFVLTHGETAACIMASVYGHVTGRLSAAVVTRGPGAASAVNGAAQATLDRHPLVLVTDTVPATSAARVPHQRLDQRSILAPASKASATLGADGDVESWTRFLGQALAAPAGAVHLDQDSTALDSTALDSTGQDPADREMTAGDVTAQNTTATVAGGRNPAVGRRTLADMISAAASVGGDRADDANPEPEPEPGERLRSLIAAATKPVLIVGLGAATGEPIVRSLEAFGAPVLTTYQAVGVIPTEHPLSAGLFTNGASERPLLRQADLIIAIGLDMVEPIPAPWTYDAPVVSLAANETTDPYLPIAAEVVGPIGALAPEFLDGANPWRWDADSGAGHRDLVRSELSNRGRPTGSANRAGRLGPLEVVEAVAAAVPADITTTVDAGAHFLAIMPWWPVSEPNRLLISNGLA
ncbi:MAG: thiamine pyrophosphate-binding protein, partial [Acidimicrobiales bacterium]